MLARGALCRLAADVPKTRIHDLPRLAHLLRAGLFSRQGASRTTTSAIARAFNAAILESRRAYATKSETESTDTVKKDVKKAVANKPAAAKKSTSATKAKPKPKKKPAAKKKAAPKKKKPAAPKKAKKPKKVLTPEEKESLAIKALKKRALKPPPAPQSTAWSVFVGEHLRSTKLESVDDGRRAFRDASAVFKNLTPAEKEHYNHLSREHTKAKQVEYDAWIRQHTPEEIEDANNARRALSRKATRGTVKGSWRRLVDERHQTDPRKLNPYIRFSTERMATGDFKGILMRDAAKLITSEWKALSADERQKYIDAWEADKAKALA